MSGKPVRETHLVVPGKSTGTIGREWHIIRRISVDEVVVRQFEVCKAAVRERPAVEGVAVGSKVPCVCDLPIAAKWDVEVTFTVEAAETIVSGAIQVVEDARRLLRLGLPGVGKLVEALSLPIVEVAIVRHLDIDHQTALEPFVKVDQMWIAIVEQGHGWLQAQRYRHAADKRLDKALVGVLLPAVVERRNKPTLAARPFEGWQQRDGTWIDHQWHGGPYCCTRYQRV